MDGTDGAKFATLQRAAEVEIESMLETLWIPMLHLCVCCLRANHAVCLSRRVVGATLWKRRALMNPTYPASLAA